MYRFSAILAFLFSESVLIVGGATNISEKWFLPRQGFHSFYRYFRERVTWDEAREICQSYRADLTTPRGEEMELLKAYLEELSVFAHVWIGLEKGMSRDYFNWISGDQVSGDGWWLEPAPKSNARLCAAIDPASDFRWTVFHCWGPETTSFACQQKVPKWAAEGCAIAELPSLIVTLEPEIGAVELTSDCGLSGTRRIVCKGRINREETVRRLSCDVDPFSEHGGTIGTPKTDGTRRTTGGFGSTTTDRLTRH